MFDRISNKCEQCVNFSNNFDVHAWIGTLDEAQQKRVQFIQKEVNYECFFAFVCKTLI